MFGPCVRTIVLNYNLLPSTSPEMWHQQNLALRSRPSPEEVGFKCEQYVLLCREQQRFMELNLAATAIVKAVELLPKLCGIKVAGSERYRRAGDGDFPPPLHDWSSVCNDLEDLRLLKLLEFRVSGAPLLLQSLASLLTTPCGAKIKSLGLGVLSRLWKMVRFR